MRRVCIALSQNPVRWVSQEGVAHEFPVSVSVGVSEFAKPSEIAAAFEAADNAASASKQAGRARVSKASDAAGRLTPDATGPTRFRQAAVDAGRDNDLAELPPLIGGGYLRASC
jgi:hypothetical protein